MIVQYRKEMSENGCAIPNPFLHQSQGGLQTRPYIDDNTNKRCEYLIFNIINTENTEQAGGA